MRRDEEMGRTRREEEKPKWITVRAGLGRSFQMLSLSHNVNMGVFGKNKAVRSWFPHAMMRTDSSKNRG